MLTTIKILVFNVHRFELLKSKSNFEIILTLKLANRASVCGILLRKRHRFSCIVASIRLSVTYSQTFNNFHRRSLLAYKATRYQISAVNFGVSLNSVWRSTSNLNGKRALFAKYFHQKVSAGRCQLALLTTITSHESQSRLNCIRLNCNVEAVRRTHCVLFELFKWSN